MKAMQKQFFLFSLLDKWWHIWLRHCSIPDGVTGTFIDLFLLPALWPWGQLSL
jgi:hypothetical protein